MNISQKAAVRLALIPLLAPLPFRGAQTLFHIDEVRRMSSEQAARAVPVRIAGVVTALSGWKNSFFLQDAGGGVSVDRTDSAEIHAGDLVEVVGATGAGMFAPVLQAHDVRILARHAQLPVARRSDYGDMAGGKQDSQRVEIRGVVHAAAVYPIWGRDVLSLVIELNGETINARVLEFPARDFGYLLDAAVMVRGVSGTIFNEQRQFQGVRVFVPSLDDVVIEKSGAADPFTLPATSLGKLLQFDPSRESGHRVHVSGVLIGEGSGGRTIYLQAGGKGVAVSTEQPVHYAVGSRLEAAGFMRSGESTPAIFDAVVRSIGTAPVPSPVHVEASEIVGVRDGFPFAYANGLLVRTEAELVDRIVRRDEHVWLLRDGSTVFEAQLPTVAGLRRSSDLADGSRVQIVGVCVADMGEDKEPKSFHILLRTQEDIELIRGPVVTTGRLTWAALGLVALSGYLLLFAFSVKLRARNETEDRFARPQKLLRYCRGAARAAGYVNAASGFACLVGGWMLGIQLPPFLASSYSAVRPLTAIGLFFGGVALCIDREGEVRPWRKNLVFLCAGSTAFAGLLPLSEFCLGQGFPIYRWFVAHGVLVLVPGRMAFFTALALAFAGLGILLTRNRSGFGIGQVFVVLAGSLCLFSAIGHLFGIHDHFGLSRLVNPILDATSNLYTTLGIANLSAGAVLSRPSWGLMIPVTSGASGGKMARRLLPAALVIPLGIGWLRMQGQALGYYDVSFGLTLFASANIAVFMFLIWKNSGRLNLMDGERDGAERHLRASEENFRGLADAMPQIVWTANASGSPDYFNRRWFDYTGVSLERAKDGGWTAACHPDDAPALNERWELALRTAGLYEVEYRIQCIGDGKYRWHLGRGVPMFDDLGNVSRWFGTCTDIEDFKAAETSVRLLNETLEERVRQRTAALAEANRELAEFRNRLRRVLDAATELAIIATDPNGIIQVFNTGAERMLQYSAGEIEGICTPAILHVAAECDTRAIELTEQLGRPVQGFEVLVALARMNICIPHEWTYIRKDGSTLEISLTCSPIRDTVDGGIRGFLGIATDIRERKSLERNLHLNNERLAEQTRRAEDANRTKSDFLAAMSHEIRTPMNAILGMADLLWESGLNDEQLQYVEVFRRAGGNLLTLINQILDHSKIEARHLDVEHVAFDLEDVVRSAIELVGAKARSKGLELMSRLVPGVPSALVGDPARLRQILINLLGNAVKFTDFGHVLLTVESLNAAAPGLIRFSVADTGIGIPAEKLGGIFEDFVQVDASITRRFGGTGLGLGISKRLVEQMGGTMGVTSSPNGSTFEFTLTFEIAPGDGLDRSCDPGNLAGHRVLIVDDNPTNRLILRESLNGWGLVSVEFGSPHEAIAHLAAGGEPFSLAILDSHMPGMNGFEAADAIRGIAPGLPIVMLSSDNRLGDAEKSRKAGLSGYAVKPVKRADLLRLISDALKMSRPAEPSPVVPAASSEARKPEKSLRILVAEDSPDNRLLVRAYLRATSHSLTFANDGFDAVQSFKTGAFDMILMDVQMPLMDGLTATREIRGWESERRLPPVPILSISANARPVDAEQSYAAGATAHLSKPISKQALLRAIDFHSSSPERTQTGTIWVHAPEGLEELVPEYLSGQRDSVPEALQWLAASDFERLGKTGHNLKGTGQSFGFPEISDIGAALEESARERDHVASRRHLQALADYLASVEVRTVT